MLYLTYKKENYLFLKKNKQKKKLLLLYKCQLTICYQKENLQFYASQLQNYYYSVLLGIGSYHYDVNF